MNQEVTHFIPSQLRRSNIQVNSVIKKRNTNRFIPVNGENGYSDRNNKIEFVVSHSELADLQSMCLSFKYTKTDAGGADDVDMDSGKPDDCIWSLIKSIEVSIADKEIERIDNIYGLLANAMSYATSNDSYYHNELNTMAGAYKLSQGADARQGDFVIPLNILGISSIKQFLPIFNTNIRIRIRLASLDESHVETDAQVGLAGGYKVDGLSMLMDTVEVVPAYESQLRDIIRSERGLAIPFSSFDVKQSKFRDLMTFNLSYAELDSLFLMVKKAGQAPTSEAPISQFDFCRFNLNGRYLGSSNDGIRTRTELYYALRKSFALLNDADGSTLLDNDTYNDFTLVGVNCEKLDGVMEDVLGVGTDTKALGYLLNVELQAGGLTPAVDDVYLACLHRKILRLANNSVSVSE